jgi:hypothetical protein
VGATAARAVSLARALVYGLSFISRRATMTMRNWIGAAFLAVGLAVSAGAALAGGDWNDGGIKWQSYDEGLAAAKASKKPVCLVIYTDWCPHCTNYSKVFHDPKVVAKSKDFVMIRLEGDKNKELSSKYAVDGAYIPRTYSLSPNGDLDKDINSGRAQYQYFYDENNPTGVLAGMDSALKKFN